MSELVRWKENRVRQEIYKELLKQTQHAPDRVDPNGASGPDSNEASRDLFEQTLAEQSGE